jgi:hypothetical protein
MRHLRRLPVLAAAVVVLTAAGAGAWGLASAATGRTTVADANRQPLDDNGRQQGARDRRSASPAPGPSAPLLPGAAPLLSPEPGDDRDDSEDSDESEDPRDAATGDAEARGSDDGGDQGDDDAVGSG